MQQFAGKVDRRTVTVPARMYCDLLISLAESLADAGWQSLLIVTGHGGNRPALTLAQQELLSRRPDFRFAWAPVTGLAANATRALDTTEVSGHSGEAETAQVLALRPDLVRSEDLKPGATRLDELAPAPRLSRVTSPSLAVTFDQYHPTGVLGDPTTVTAEDGTKTAHPTVKPLALMRWLVRMVTPPNGTVLDPFAGSGTTLEAAMLEGFNVTGIEREADYLPLIQARLDRATDNGAAS